jgi:hypothetical protein
VSRVTPDGPFAEQEPFTTAPGGAGPLLAIPVVLTERIEPGKFALRSMSRFERGLRRQAGADRRWALLLLDLCERWWLRGI